MRYVRSVPTSVAHSIIQWERLYFLMIVILMCAVGLNLTWRAWSFKSCARSFSVVNHASVILSYTMLYFRSGGGGTCNNDKLESSFFKRNDWMRIERWMSIFNVTLDFIIANATTMQRTYSSIVAWIDVVVVVSVTCRDLINFTHVHNVIKFALQ